MILVFIAGVAFTHLFWLAVFFGWALWEARGLGELPQDEATQRSGYMRGRDGFAHKIR